MLDIGRQPSRIGKKRRATPLRASQGASFVLFKAWLPLPDDCDWFEPVA
jgi:hypothetical protein